MAISGSGKIKREKHLIGYVYTEESTEKYELIGHDNDDMSRTLNNDVESKRNVLGETTVEVTQGTHVTTVDPFIGRYDSKLFQKLDEIYNSDLELDDVVETFIDISEYDEVSTGEYRAFKQKAAIDLKSLGGSKSLGAPFDLNWLGSKTYGTFNPTTKKFTETTSD